MATPTPPCRIAEPFSQGVATSSEELATVEVDRPVAHTWSGFQKFRKKFCNVCRKRMDDRVGARCVICKYYAHKRCLPVSQPMCKRAADYNTFVTPDEHCLTRHQWMGGNLKTSDKCSVCGYICGTSDSLTGMRCLWCLCTVHNACHSQASPRCEAGILNRLVLPSYSVHYPRLSLEREVAMTPVASDIDVCGRFLDRPVLQTSDIDVCDRFLDRPVLQTSISDAELDEQSIAEGLLNEGEELILAAGSVALKVYDSCLNFYKKIIVGVEADSNTMLLAALQEFNIAESEVQRFCLALETAPESYEPVEKWAGDLAATDKLVVRSKASDDLLSQIRIYLSCNNEDLQWCTVEVSANTSADEVVSLAIKEFRLIIPSWHRKNYALVEANMYDGVCERRLDDAERPAKIMRDFARVSVQQLQMVRLYLRNISMDLPITLYVGKLPTSYSEDKLATALKQGLSPLADNVTFGPVFTKLGCAFLYVMNAESAQQVCTSLQTSVLIEKKHPKVFRVPTIQEEVLPDDCSPLLAFVNERSGGGQGAELMTQLMRMLNPYQVFNLSHGGPMPGLFAFRKLKSFRILVAGGDGTVGWVLSRMDEMREMFACPNASVAVIPLGTGNDLARVLRWGGGFSGESAMSILETMEESLVVPLDRWNIEIESKATATADTTIVATDANGLADSAPSFVSQSFIMNNYVGIGVEAEIALKFHLAREENPEKFNSRLHNKGVYLKMSIGKMMQRTVNSDSSKDLSKAVTLDVDGERIKIPSGVEGIIVLNIKSWMAGCDGWGTEKDDKFKPPSMNDGLLEIIGVQGVMHLGQIQGGMRGGIRLAQGSDISLLVTCSTPFEIDGEPFMQGPSMCHITQGKSVHMMRRYKRQLASDSHTGGGRSSSIRHSSLRSSGRRSHKQ
eukprot:scpid28524/ scgid2416/ Diacylglycerol kinase theta; Diglyceride kinase theta